MKPFRMKNIISGSKGNCSFLVLEEDLLILFDLGISYKQLKNRLAFIADLETTEWHVLVLITHEHGDHWNKKTYKNLDSLPNLHVTLQFPSGIEQIVWNDHNIESKAFKHGDTTSNFFIVDHEFGYLTDVQGSELLNILAWPPAYNLEELFIEANYDENNLDYTVQASIANGYNVSQGFERHLSIQQSAFLIKSLNPQRAETLHHSSRFYEKIDKE